MKIFFIFLMCCFIVVNIYAETETDNIYRDPFDTQIPEQKKEDFSEGISTYKDEIKPPQLNVEGVLWGTDMPQAIIDGEVYKVGDMISPETQIFNIEKNVVLIRHKGKIFEFTPGMKGIEKKEAK
ncbi:MAG: general secretion pathway protein GspB [Candidatus Omnitrophica bacterium]|nr:general secretion pathway protein GspB [Candidatus Omnitrophota bacterium]